MRVEMMESTQQVFSRGQLMVDDKGSTFQQDRIIRDVSSRMKLDLIHKLMGKCRMGQEIRFKWGELRYFYANHLTIEQILYYPTAPDARLPKYTPGQLLKGAGGHTNMIVDVRFSKFGQATYYLLPAQLGDFPTMRHAEMLSRSYPLLEDELDRDFYIVLDKLAQR